MFVLIQQQLGPTEYRARFARNAGIWPTMHSWALEVTANVNSWRKVDIRLLLLTPIGPQSFSANEWLSHWQRQAGR